MSRGYYKRRRGLIEHLESGKISLLDLAVHDYLNLRANLIIGSDSSIPAGVCITSAGAIHATCPSRISERAIQRSLEHLAKIGWIKRWNVRGKRGNYPTLVCRGTVHDLSGNEYRVNGEETTDWRSPVYEPVGDLSSLREVADAKLSGDREVRSREQRKKPAPPTDPRHQPFVDFAYKTFEEKHKVKPSWLGKDFEHLRVLLKANASLNAAELERRWRNYLDSTEPFTAKQGDSLAYFADRCDSFANGPILGGNNGAANGNSRAVPAQPGKYANLPVARFEN